MKTVLISLVILCVSNIIAAFPYLSEKDGGGFVVKRAPDDNHDWNALGWAWGKRSMPTEEIPRRLMRAVHAVKKNPDWHDLGWTWGKK